MHQHRWKSMVRIIKTRTARRERLDRKRHADLSPPFNTSREALLTPPIQRSCYRCPVAVAVPRVHDLRAEELPVGEAVRARLVHGQSPEPPSPGSHEAHHQRLIATALPRDLPRREGLPLSVSTRTQIHSLHSASREIRLSSRRGGARNLRSRLIYDDRVVQSGGKIEIVPPPSFPPLSRGEYCLAEAQFIKLPHREKLPRLFRKKIK